MTRMKFKAPAPPKDAKPVTLLKCDWDTLDALADGYVIHETPGCTNLGMTFIGGGLRINLTLSHASRTRLMKAGYVVDNRITESGRMAMADFMSDVERKRREGLIALGAKWVFHFEGDVLPWLAMNTLGKVVHAPLSGMNYLGIQNIGDPKTLCAGLHILYTKNGIPCNTPKIVRVEDLFATPHNHQ